MKLAKQYLFLLGIVWLSLSFYGMYVLFKYSAFPGLDGEPPKRMISKTQVKHKKNIPTLIVFLHPRCPCSRATISELGVIISKAQNPLNLNIVFFKPSIFPESWTMTDLWDSAKRIPNAKLIADNGGKEIKQFCVKTSGHVLLYNSREDLVFSGGITASRGHLGDNEGRQAVLSLLNREKSNVSKTKTFGCQLNDE